MDPPWTAGKWGSATLGHTFRALLDQARKEMKWKTKSILSTKTYLVVLGDVLGARVKYVKLRMESEEGWVFQGPVHGQKGHGRGFSVQTVHPESAFTRWSTLRYVRKVVEPAWQRDRDTDEGNIFGVEVQNSEGAVLVFLQTVRFSSNQIVQSQSMVRNRAHQGFSAFLPTPGLVWQWYPITKTLLRF